MPYAWNGTCYETPESALLGFQRDIPTADGSAITSFTAAPTIDAQGVITWSINHRPLSSDVPTIRAGTTQLQPCIYDGFSTDSMPDLLVIVGLVFAFFIGFRSGQSA